ncbi:MAG: hypothetical protein ACRC67_33665 [Inquilinus sp.]|uniref:hypothetical protein n=1 Tax=Inquilinus sp. TaxID=1932117 RepID=UPI003F39B6F6
METLPSGAEVTTAVTELLRSDLALARKVDALFKDPDFVTFMDDRVASDDPERPAPDPEEIQAAVRQIINEIGARPSDKNAAIRWGLNFWQVAKTTGLISLLGFGLRPGFQSLTAQSLNLGQPDQNTGLAEGVYYTGQAVSSLIMLTSAALNAKDQNWDATIGDLIYALSMLGGIGFARSYDVAAGLAPATVGAAFYATFTEILKTFRTMKVPQLAGVDPTGWRKIGVYMAGATTFTLSFIPATAWSYSNDYVGPGRFADQDAGDLIRRGAQIGVLWAGALVGYNVLTPPLVKLVAGNQFGAIAPLEYEAEWKSNRELIEKSPKELLSSAFAVANDANKFFAFVLAFNTFLALNGGIRLGPAGQDAIPNEALRIFVNTVISSIFCLGLCYIYEMQYGTKKQKPSEVLTEGSEGHDRVEAALDAFYTDVVTAEEPIAIGDLPDLIGQRAATLQTDAESALFTMLVYTRTVPRVIEEDRIASAAPTPEHSEPARSEQGDRERDASPAEDTGALPGQESLAMRRRQPPSSGPQAERERRRQEIDAAERDAIKAAQDRATQARTDLDTSETGRQEDVAARQQTIQADEEKAIAAAGTKAAADENHRKTDEDAQRTARVTTEQTSLQQEQAAVAATRQAAIRTATEQDELEQARLKAARETLATDRETQRTEDEALEGEEKRLATETSALETKGKALATERGRLRTVRETLESERAGRVIEIRQADEAITAEQAERQAVEERQAEWRDLETGETGLDTDETALAASQERRQAELKHLETGRAAAIARREQNDRRQQQIETDDKAAKTALDDRIAAAEAQAIREENDRAAAAAERERVAVEQEQTLRNQRQAAIAQARQNAVDAAGQTARDQSAEARRLDTEATQAAATRRRAIDTTEQQEIRDARRQAEEQRARLNPGEAA